MYDEEPVLTRYSIEESVKEDVAFLKASPFLKPGTHIVGLKYDIMTGVVETLGESVIGS